MKPPDQVKKEFVRQWLAKADADLRTSQHLLSSGPAYVLGTAFHAQQAAEMALKALFLERNAKLYLRHSIDQLATLSSTRPHRYGAQQAR